jgi:hypothetical protein
LLLAAGLFIDSQNLVDDGSSFDLVMVETRRLFQCVLWRRWSLATAAGFGECKNPRDSFVIYYLWVFSVKFSG